MTSKQPKKILLFFAHPDDETSRLLAKLSLGEGYHVSYVNAVRGQGGQNSERRRTYGHSLICDPWGRVVTEMGEGPGLVAAELDLDQVANLRTRMPVWEHRRLKG